MKIVLPWFNEQSMKYHVSSSNNICLRYKDNAIMSHSFLIWLFDLIIVLVAAVTSAYQQAIRCTLQPNNEPYIQFSSLWGHPACSLQSPQASHLLSLRCGSHSSMSKLSSMPVTLLTKAIIDVPAHQSFHQSSRPPKLSSMSMPFSVKAIIDAPAKS